MVMLLHKMQCLSCKNNLSYFKMWSSLEDLLIWPTKITIKFSLNQFIRSLQLFQQLFYSTFLCLKQRQYCCQQVLTAIPTNISLFTDICQRNQKLVNYVLILSQFSVVGQWEPRLYLYNLPHFSDVSKTFHVTYPETFQGSYLLSVLIKRCF